MFVEKTDFDGDDHPVWLHEVRKFKSMKILLIIERSDFGNINRFRTDLMNKYAGDSLVDIFKFCYITNGMSLMFRIQLLELKLLIQGED